MVKLVVFKRLAESDLHHCSQFLSDYFTTPYEYHCWLVSSLSDPQLATFETHRSTKVLRVVDDVAMILRLSKEFASGSYSNGDMVFLLGFEENLANALKDYCRAKIFCYSYTASRLHELFGCTKACTVQCQHCSTCFSSHMLFSVDTKYKMCDEKQREQHEVMYRAGICLNNNCDVMFPKCARPSEKTNAHVQQHKICKICRTAGMECLSRCSSCFPAALHCKNGCPKLLADKDAFIASNQCPLCNRRYTGSPFAKREDLCAHMQTCFAKSPHSTYHPYVQKCDCGTVLMDDAHRKQHKPLKGNTCSPLRTESAQPSAYLDDGWYPASTVPKAAAAAPKAPSVPARAAGVNTSPPVASVVVPVPQSSPAAAYTAASASSPALPPAPRAEAPAGSPPVSVAHGPLEAAILSVLSVSGDFSPLFRITDAEERCILAKAEELQNLLIKCQLGIASFQKQGSLWPKAPRYQGTPTSTSW
jgi:hypothetical protein